MTELRPVSEILPSSGRHDPAGRSGPDEAKLSRSDELVLELVEVGIGLRKAESLVRAYPEPRIRKQLEWLPMRAARKPASLLIAAIEHDYDPPVYAAP